MQRSNSSIKLFTSLILVSNILFTRCLERVGKYVITLSASQVFQRQSYLTKVDIVFTISFKGEIYAQKVCGDNQP